MWPVKDQSNDVTLMIYKYTVWFVLDVKPSLGILDSHGAVQSMGMPLSKDTKNKSIIPGEYCIIKVSAPHLKLG